MEPVSIDHFSRTLPDRPEARFLITGATGGLGYFTAEALAVTGAQVLLGARDAARGRRAAEAIRRRVGRAKVEIVDLDLTDRDSIEGAAVSVGADRLDGLVLNAGTTTPPRTRRTTAEGNEYTLATNVIGHAVLTAKLLPALAATTTASTVPPPRVVGLGSLSTVIVGLAADDLQSEREYRPFRAYGLSKHAMHGLIFELDRRLRREGSRVQALLAHPGYAVDALSPQRPGIVVPRPHERLPIAQGKAAGALPTLRALLDPSLSGGAFLGPRWLTRGPAVPVSAVASSRSESFGSQLFEQLHLWSGGAFRL